MAAVHPGSTSLPVFDDQLYRLIAETIPHMVWTADPNGVSDYQNQRMYDYTGLDAEALAGTGWKQIVHPEDLERCLAAWEHAQIEGERFEIEYRLRRADGAYRWHHASALPLRRRDGRVYRWFGTVTDIDAQVRGAQILESMVEERTRALHESEQRFQAFMENLPGVAWIRDAQFRYTYVNRSYAALWGLAPAQLIGRDPKELLPAEMARYFRESEDEVLRNGGPVQFVDGLPTGRWLKMKFPVPDGAGGTGIAGIGIDITERSRLEEALRESEQRFKTFMGNAPVRAWIKDSKLRYTYVNHAFEAEHNLEATNVIGRDDFEVFPEKTARYFRSDDESVLEAGRPVQRTRQSPPDDGAAPRPHWLVVKFPLADAGGAMGIGGISMDVTARVEAEENARRYAEQVRHLVNRLVQAQEAERRRVADELHDLIGQNLTALGIDLQALKQQLQAAGDLRAAPRLDAMATLVEGTIDAIRGVMTDLRPAALEEFGLVSALRWYSSQFAKRTGMKVAMRSNGREVRLPRDQELALFRIAQEALTNAAKHSGGKSVDIQLGWKQGRLRLAVADDGRGFSDPAGARTARRGGFGLPTMRERAEALGGELRVEFPGQGTRIVVELPVQASA